MPHKKIGRNSKKNRAYNKKVEKYCENFYTLLGQVEEPAPGTYDIEIAEILIIGLFPLVPTIAIIEDTQGKIWSIPESSGNNDKKNALVSRWDIRPGMKLRLEVTSPPSIPPYNNITAIVVK